MPRLAVVILSYNRADLLADCLASLYAAPTRCALAVWVVDNASSDGSPALVRERFPQARLIVSPCGAGRLVAVRCRALLRERRPGAERQHHARGRRVVRQSSSAHFVSFLLLCRVLPRPGQ